MGILKDTKYWNDVVQQMVPFRPVGPNPPTPEDTRRLLAIACSAFSRLVNDPDLLQDLDQMVQAAAQGARNLPEGTAAVRGYLIAFRQVEIEILRNANVPEEAIITLDEEIAAMVTRGGVDWNDFEDVVGRLKFIQQKVCSYAADHSFAEAAPPELNQLLIGAATGAAIGAADLGVVGLTAAAAFAAPPAIAAAAAGGAAGAGALAAMSLAVPLSRWRKLARHLGW